MPRKARSIEPPIYLVTPLATPERAAEDDIIHRALEILLSRARTGDIISTPSAARDLCRLRFGGLEHEEFGVVFLDAQHRVIAVESMFRGTLAQSSVYPREVVRRALALNAGAVILTHNHPSGSTEPSRADEYLTQTLKAALALVDVRVLDHIVVSVEGTTSMAERGLL